MKQQGFFNFFVVALLIILFGVTFRLAREVEDLHVLVSQHNQLERDLWFTQRSFNRRVSTRFERVAIATSNLSILDEVK